MAELMACRRPPDPAGGDTASQHEVVPDNNGSGSLLDPSQMLSPLRCPVYAGAVLPAVGRGGAPTVTGFAALCARLPPPGQHGGRVGCRRRRVCLRQQTTAMRRRRQPPAVQFNRSRMAQHVRMLF